MSDPYLQPWGVRGDGMEMREQARKLHSVRRRNRDGPGYHDECPRCGGKKRKVSNLCRKCHQAEVMG